MKKILLILFLTVSLFGYADKLQNYIYKKFVSYYPSMSVDNITVKPNIVIPKGYKLDRVYFQNNSLKRESGNFSAIFVKDNREKRVYFKYKIDAKVPVLVANYDISSHTVLDSTMFTQTMIRFSNFYDKPVVDVSGMESKVFIPRGKILIRRLVRKIPLIHRGDMVQAVVKDGGIELFLSVKALNDGSRGEIIRVKRDGYKILKAKVISSAKVEIK